MGNIVIPKKVTLISGMLASSVELLCESRRELERTVGAIDRVSDIWPFEDSDYYADEMGGDIQRQFVSFRDLFAMDALPEIKRRTNDLEVRIAERHGRDAGHRPVNLDPGYVHLGGLVLATTKQRDHRIYLGQGIFAELTLSFHHGGWQSWPWTYPDFASGRYDKFLTTVRQDLKQRLRNGCTSNERDNF